MEIFFNQKIQNRNKIEVVFHRPRQKVWKNAKTPTRQKKKPIVFLFLETFLYFVIQETIPKSIWK